MGEFSEKLGDANVKGFMLDLVKREFYMDTFGVGDLDDKKNPLAMVTMNSAEGLHVLWPYLQKARKFMLYEAEKYLGCSLFEFLEQPTAIVDSLLEDLGEQHVQRMKAQQSQENAAKREQEKSPLRVPGAIRPPRGFDEFEL